MLAELTLWTGDAPAIDYAPILQAWHGRRFALLRLESAREAAPVLELFASAVAGAWAMTVGRKGWRLVLVAEREATFDVDLASPFSLAREPRSGKHLTHIAAPFAHATLLVQMATSACTPPELRRLAFEVTPRPEWPSDRSGCRSSRCHGTAVSATDGFP